jgi:hypothetical protein
MSHHLHTCLALALLFSTALSSSAQEYIPFRLEGNLLIIEANLNGQTGKFLLDTGAPELIVNERYFEGTRVSRDQRQLVDFNGHTSEARRYAVTKFSIGDLTIKKQFALSVDLTSIEKVKGIQLLGIIGYSILKDLELLFDFDRHELSIAPSQKKGFAFTVSESPDAIFDLRFSGHLPYLVAQIGKKKFRFGLDTGSEVNIIDEKSFKPVADHFDEVKKIQVKGITHHQQAATSGTLQNLTIHDRPLGPLAVTVINLESLNEGLTIGLDGILGMPFFGKGRVGVDYGERRMWVWGSDGLLVEGE